MGSRRIECGSLRRSCERSGPTTQRDAWRVDRDDRGRPPDGDPDRSALHEVKPRRDSRLRDQRVVRVAVWVGSRADAVARIPTIGGPHAVAKFSDACVIDEGSSSESAMRVLPSSERLD